MNIDILLNRRAALRTGSAASMSATALFIGGCSISTAPSPATTRASPVSPAAPGGVLGPAADIPVGGGTIFDAEKVVVTQPNAGTFKAFSAVCTHLGCLVSKVVDGSIYCPCHGSKFNINDGSVTVGPATRPLPPEKIINKSGTITLD